MMWKLSVDICKILVDKSQSTSTLTNNYQTK